MPRVHSQRARKDYNREGIKRGDIYYKWTLRPGGPGARGTLYRSATYPKPWQLTSSPFLQQQYQLEDRIANLGARDAGEIEDIATEIRDLGEEQFEKIQNMPDSLQYSPTGEMLQERADACEQWAEQLESVQVPDDEDDEDERETFVNELQNCMYEG